MWVKEIHGKLGDRTVDNRFANFCVVRVSEFENLHRDRHRGLRQSLSGFGNDLLDVRQKFRMSAIALRKFRRNRAANLRETNRRRRRGFRSIFRSALRSNCTAQNRFEQMPPRPDADIAARHVKMHGEFVSFGSRCTLDQFFESSGVPTGMPKRETTFGVLRRTPRCSVCTSPFSTSSMT
jgi:hypothetical protein